VDYEWDEAKARANLRDHSIDFADAATVFDDDLALTCRMTQRAKNAMTLWAWMPWDDSW